MANNTTAGPPAWINQRRNWLAAATPATFSTSTEPKVRDISVRDGAGVIQQLTRIDAAADMNFEPTSIPVGQQIASIQPIGVPIKDPYGPGGEFGPVSPFPTHKDPETGQMVPGPNPVPTKDNAQPVVPAAPSNPVPAQQQPAPVPAGPANQNPQPNNPSDPKVVSPNLPDHISPLSPGMRALFPTLADLYNPDGSLKTPEEQQLAQAASAMQSSPPVLPDPDGKLANAPYIPGITAPKPKPVTVTAEATVPVQPAIPEAITHPVTVFRIGSNRASGYSYTEDQLYADLATFRAGRPIPLQGPGVADTAVAQYELARARLLAAQYSATEQATDLKWAFFTPRNAKEESGKQAALARLYEGGIPWRVPGVEEYLAQDTRAYFNDPSRPGRWAAPQLLTPAQIQQEILRANRPDGIGFTEFANKLLMDMTIGPAIVLWDAAHDRGDHSGWEIAGAAAMLGINILTIVPGAGTLAATAARQGLRAIAPEFMAELAALKTSAEAAQIARIRQNQQLLADIDRYGQRVAIPPRNIGLPPPSAAPLDLGSGAVVKEGGAIGTKGLELPRGPGPEVPPAIPQMKEAPAAASETKPTHVEFSDKMPLNPVLDREVTVQLETSAPIPAWKPAQVFDEAANFEALPRFGDLRTAQPADFDYLQIGRGLDETAPSVTSASRSADPTFDRLIKQNEAIRNGPITRGEAGANRRNAKAFENKRTISNGEANGTINGKRYENELGGVSGEVENLRGTPGEALSQLPEDNNLIFNTEHVGHDRALDSEPKIFENLARDILRNASGKSADVVAEAVSNAIRRAPLNPRGYPLDSRAVVHDIANQLGVDLSKIDIEVKLVIDFPWGREFLTSPEVIYQQICDSCRPLMRAFQKAFDDRVVIKARNLDDVPLWPL